MLVHAMLAASIVVQDTVPSGDSSFLRRREAVIGVATLAATAALSLYDERIARWTRQPNVQGDSARHRLVSRVTWVNEMPLTAGAIAAWGIGRLTRSRTIADVGLHVTESLLAAEVVAEVIRVASGRVRPRASPDDAFSFEPGKGLTVFENRSFPSLHAAVAFTTAASLAEEVRHHKPEAFKYAAPLLYGAAMVPGLTRLYLDQHWASDVLAGSVLGAVLGARVVRYAHGRRTKLDRILLGATVVPTTSGVALAFEM
jgi:membrane-associated phospholipid phosphatase